jgi:hypothetical protein
VRLLGHRLEGIARRALEALLADGAGVTAVEHNHLARRATGVEQRA